MDPTNYIAIVGVGRSGTTLLMSMLHAHSDIAFPPEFHFIRNYLSRNATLPYDALCERLRQDPYFERLGLTVEEAIGDRPDENGAIDLASFYRRILNHFARKKDAKFVGDKDPKNIEHLPIIAALFKRPYVVHVIRDPRDVYLSRTKAAWSKGGSKYRHLLAYRAQLMMGFRGVERFGDRYIEIRFEDLLADPEATLKDLCTRLNLPFEEQMLEHERTAPQLISDDEIQWKGAVLKPVMPDNAGKWRQAGMDRDLLLAIEAACRPAFKPPYYEPSVTADTPMESLRTILWDKGMDLLARLYQRDLERKEAKAVKRLAGLGSD